MEILKFNNVKWIIFFFSVFFDVEFEFAVLFLRSPLVFELQK